MGKEIQELLRVIEEARDERKEQDSDLWLWDQEKLTNAGFINALDQVEEYIKENF